MKGKKTNTGIDTKLVSVYLPIEVFAKLAVKAKDEDRSVSKAASRIITEALRNE
jgi:hypothetical protein